MRIIPLGGADEIGASSTLVEFGSTRILVDAGIRLGEEVDPLPDLDSLQSEVGRLDAVILTHAHIDHSGSLPLVHLAFPTAPIYMTPATAAVVRILFADNLKIMEGKSREEGIIPLYPSHAVESCLGKIRPVPYERSVKIAPDVGIVFHPAGHILGASSVSIHGPTGSILISGDISVTQQHTVPGMLPPNRDFDVVLMESTYGNRLHAHRPTQERKLLEVVGDTLERGGKVLFPAFAVGRAQEIILILRKAIREGKLPPVPIFIDGMVQSVCDAYSRFPTYLQRHLQQLLERGDNPFFPAGGNIFRVRSPRQRERVLESDSCCIIASSGMMTGGPSAFYARHIISDSRNTIAITGYQDEESPGRKLLQLAERPPHERFWQFEDRRLSVSCRVEKYSLSAHADKAQILSIIDQISPSQGVILVHGDSRARESLAETVSETIGTPVHLPSNGETLQFKGKKKNFFFYSSETTPLGLGGSRPLDEKALSQLHQALWSETQGRGLFRASDLFFRWYGPQSEFSPEESDRLYKLLSGDQPYFYPDPQRPYLFRLRDPKKILKSKSRRNGRRGNKMEMNRALQIVDTIFPRDSGLYKKGARAEQSKLLLFFHFPKVARRKYARELQLLEQKTGWTVELNSMPHHAALEEQARRMVPPQLELVKNPSIQHGEETVSLILIPKEKDADRRELENILDSISEKFREITGYSLRYKLVRREKGTSRSRRSRSPRSEDYPLEINRAYRVIEERFNDFIHKPYKKSKVGNSIVLSFISPQVARLYLDVIEELKNKTGWNIEINPEPNLYGIKQEVRLLLPPNWELLKDPAPFKDRAVVRIYLASRPPSDELAEIAARVYQRTGYYLEVKVS